MSAPERRKPGSHPSGLPLEPALALLDFGSIAVGMQAADAMVKRAPIEALRSGTVHNGKYLVLIGGQVADVEESLAAGRMTGGADLLDYVLLPQVHPDVIECIGGHRAPQATDALGVIETVTTAAAIHAADAGLKAAWVTLVEVRLADGLGGKGIVLFSGLVADVQAAVQAENVMRSQDGTVKVLDFGLAHLEQEEGETRLTRTGTLLGTPGYIAPEQLMGEEAGPASDIYALGLVMQEMLTGQHAFSGSNNSATALMARVLQGVPNQLPPAVVMERPGLDEVVRRCLARRPDERFISMTALAASLERLAQPSSPTLPFLSPSSSRQPQSPTHWWQMHHSPGSLR